MFHVITSKEFNPPNEILDKFKFIFKMPKRFNISFFRARFPDQERAIYDWHQDEGTWFMSNDKKNLNKFTATLWFSINGANKQDSIQLLKNSHKNILYNHTFIKGQGYFSAKLKKFKFDDILASGDPLGYQIELREQIKKNFSFDNREKLFLAREHF